MQAFTFDEASHVYRLDGHRLPSVTEILAPIKPDFSMVPPAVLEAKRAFGTAVHLACELDDLGELDDDATDPAVMSCVQAWRRFRSDTGATVVMNEQRLYHPALRFAGTLDRLAYLRMKGDDQPSTWLLDIKTGAEPMPSFGVQLAGYRLLLTAQEDPGPLSSAFGEAFRSIGADSIKRASVHLDASGGYRFHEYRDPADEATFMACLAIHRFKEKHA